MFFNLPLYSYAYNDFSYKDYIKGVNEGWIGKDVSYDMLVKINKQAQNNYINNNFTKVYSAENFQDFDDFDIVDKTTAQAMLRVNVTKFNPGDVFIMNSSIVFGLVWACSYGYVK